MILLRAASRCSRVTSPTPSRAAKIAASFRRLPRSAPEKPGVPLAMEARLDALGELHVAGMNVEDRLATGDVGKPDMDLTVEAARTQERRVEHVDAVRGTDDDHAGRGVEAVHLDEKLVQGRLELPVRRRSPAPALAADGVDLVDEDQAGRLLAGLLEELGDAALGDADQRSREVASRDRHEGHAGLAGERLGDQGLAGSGRPDHQQAARNAGADPA